MAAAKHGPKYEEFGGLEAVSEEMTINLGEWKKPEGRNHITYSVHTTTTLLKQAQYQVSRRYSDFAWLFDTLTATFPCLFIPLVPDKSIVTSVTGGRFEKDFVEKRRRALESFLRRLARHQEIRHDANFQNFLQLGEQDFSASRVKAPAKGQGILNAGFGFISSMFQGKLLAQASSVDPETETERIYFKDLETQLIQLHAHTEKAIHHRKELGVCLGQMSSQLTALTHVDDKKISNSTDTLVHYISSAADTAAKKTVAHANTEAETLLDFLDDYVRVVGGALAAYKSRTDTIDEKNFAESEIARLRQRGDNPTKVKELEKRVIDLKASADRMLVVLTQQNRIFHTHKFQDFSTASRAFVAAQVASFSEGGGGWTECEQKISTLLSKKKDDDAASH